jgi:hypothetical protein
MGHTVKAGGVNEARGVRNTGMLFDLDGTLIDSVYQHVLAWREALEAEGIDIPVWKIHRKIGMSGGLFARALLREVGAPIGPDVAERLQARHHDAFERVGRVRHRRARSCRRLPGVRGPGRPPAPPRRGRDPRARVTRRSEPATA